MECSLIIKKEEKNLSIHKRERDMIYIDILGTHRTFINLKENKGVRKNIDPI